VTKLFNNFVNTNGVISYCIAFLFCLVMVFTLDIFSVYSQDNPNQLPTFSKANEKVDREELLRVMESIDGLEDEFVLLIDQYVSIASKVEEKARKAPSIVSIITAREIEDMGARTLAEVLRTVPGFDILKAADFGTVLTGSRGVRNAVNRVKVMIDGHSLNNPFNEEPAAFFDDLNIKNAKQIEIIRGPGSALYGANAFMAVINIVSREAVDINGIGVSSGFGSYDTQEYSVQFGKRLKGIDIVGFADFFNTNGISETIKKDITSGQPFSNVPGDTDDGRNKLDLYLKSSYKNINFIAKYLNKDKEPFVGPNFVLTNDGEDHFNYAMGELNYQFDVSDKITIKPRVYYDQYDIEFFIEPFPDGFVIPEDLDGDGDIEEFPNGMITNGKTTNRRLGSEIQINYNILDNNKVTLGFDYKWERQDNVTLHSNFSPVTNASLGSIHNVSDTNWLRRVYRQVWAIYLQDKWDISDKIAFTFGVRHDHYSDFEGTTNPRIGFVWDFAKDYTLKLLYGQAFRAPNFSELYAENNPVRVGNTDLKPETIRTYEIELAYNVRNGLSVKTDYFYNVIRGEIELVPTNDIFTVWDNHRDSNIQGIEFEAKADLSDYWPDAYAFANYTYQDAESKGDPLPDVPKHKGNVGINAGITKHLNANLHAFVSGSRIREEADARDDSPGYTLLNLTLKAKNFYKEMWIKTSMDNLLDKKYDDPTPINTIPTDIPRPGRTFFIELGYDF